MRKIFDGFYCFWDMIRCIQEREGLTVAQIARQLGTSRQNLYNYKKEYPVTKKTVYSLCFLYFPTVDARIAEDAFERFVNSQKLQRV